MDLNDLNIIYEDKHIFVINKPSGLVVNKSNTTKNKTLQEIIMESDKFSNLFDGISEDSIFWKRGGMAHRIDKDTSGVILFAKNQKALISLMDEFKNRRVDKEYVALVYGEISEEIIEIDAPLGRNPVNRVKMAVTEPGRPSLTIIERIKDVSMENIHFTLVRAKPVTGRTHQIRVHLTALNHPVVGDSLYAGKKRNEITKDKYGRLMLHAHKLTIKHPKDGKKVTFEAPLPKPLSYKV